MNLKEFAIHELQQAHILYQNCINANLSQLIYKTLSLRKLIVVDYSIERYINLSIKLMCVITQFTYIVDAIAYSSPGSEFWCSDVNSISTMINGCDATSQILGRS